MKHGSLVLAILVACASKRVGVTAHTSAPQDAPAVVSLPAIGATVSAAPTCVMPTETVDAASALASIRAGHLPLTSWHFQRDTNASGDSFGWSTARFDDSAWPIINTGDTWQNQDFPGNGLGWYRKHVYIPADWAGSKVHLDARGVDDEYDLWVNGTYITHFGAQQSVYQTLTEARIEDALLPGQDNVIVLRVNDWGGGGGIVQPIGIRRSVPLEQWRSLLPSPIIDSQPDWIALYWEAWQLAFDHITFGTPANGFAAAYMDPAFDGNIYQWDSSFITMFGRYGLRLFPVMATLDNFYAKQTSDGYIQRVYSGVTGAEVNPPSVDEPMVNPPLFAWVEWQYYQFSGDGSRLPRVLPILEKYFAWLKANVRSTSAPGLYYQTGLGSGMDNTPRGDIGYAGWEDMSMQQALAAHMLANISDAIGLPDHRAQWDSEYAALGAAIDEALWSDVDGIYYDRTRSGTHAGVRHIGAFWALIAGIADSDKSDRLVAHLEDPAEFHRDHLFPSLAASDPGYVPAGNYWRGSVWAPTDFMVIKGLDATGHADLAREAAASHIDHLSKVYQNPPTDMSKYAPEQVGGDYHTIWECYSADATAPATRWDDTYYSRQDFVGWSGLGPIALLLEDVIGIDVNGAANRITWTISRTDRHGVENLSFADNVVSLVASQRASTDAPVSIAITAAQAFTLEVVRPNGQPLVQSVAAGCSMLTLP